MTHGVPIHTTITDSGFNKEFSYDLRKFRYTFGTLNAATNSMEQIHREAEMLSAFYEAKQLPPS